MSVDQKGLLCWRSLHNPSEIQSRRRLSLFRLRENQDDLSPVEGQTYRPARKSCVVKLEAVDEDFVVAHRRMRAIPLSSDSFREVASGLSAANEAMNQLSRIGRRSTKPPRDHDPTSDSLAFDDWMETIVSKQEVQVLQLI